LEISNLKLFNPPRPFRVLRASEVNRPPTSFQVRFHFQVKFYAGRLLGLLLSSVLLVMPPSSFAGEKKPKKAIKDSDARKVIAATPGFGLRTGAVRVKDVSLAGATPVVVNAEVEIAFGFTKTEAGGEGPRWRAVEFRTGDRAWEEFDYLAGPLGAERVESARSELEALAAEFEAEQRERKAAEERAEKDKAKDKAGDARVEEAARAGEAKDEKAKGGKSKDRKAKDNQSGEGKSEDEKAADEKKLEVRRGPLLMKEFAPMYKSARAVVVVDASFRLEKDARGKWRVVGFSVGDASFDNFDELIAGVNARKAARARADLEAVRAALEAFRRERGFYVVAEDETVLIDHLSPRYLKTVIRIDPWHRPYRYAGTGQRFTLASDGPDGLPSTADDVTISG